MEERAHRTGRSDKGLLTSDNCVAALIDHQPQMVFGVANADPQTINSNVVALASAELRRGRWEAPRPLGVWALGLVLLVSTLGCQRAKVADQAAAAPTVVVAEVVQRTVPIVREYTARTEAVPTVEVRARVPGVLEQVLLEEGLGVTRGQTLFVIQREEYAAVLESARAHLAKAQADLTRAQDVSVIDRSRAQLEQRKADQQKSRQDVNRYRPLAEARAIPQQDLDTAVAQDKVAAAAVDEAAAALKDTELALRTQVQLAEAAVQSARAALVQAELNLGYTIVRSPIDGIIGRVQVDRGNLVGKSEPTLLATVSAVDPIYVDFPIAEADFLRYAPRIRLDSVSAARDGRPWFDLILADGSSFPHKGRATFIDRAVDVRTGTIAVRASSPSVRGPGGTGSGPHLTDLPSPCRAPPPRATLRPP